MVANLVNRARQRVYHQYEEMSLNETKWIGKGQTVKLHLESINDHAATV